MQSSKASVSFAPETVFVENKPAKLKMNVILSGGRKSTSSALPTSIAVSRLCSIFLLAFLTLVPDIEWRPPEDDNEEEEEAKSKEATTVDVPAKAIANDKAQYGSMVLGYK
jgi:hypothetical protein